ncbi:hypothetical protein OB08_12875 [Microbacterium sp. HJ5]
MVAAMNSSEYQSGSRAPTERLATVDGGQLIDVHRVDQEPDADECEDHGEDICQVDEALEQTADQNLHRNS